MDYGLALYEMAMLCKKYHIEFRVRFTGSETRHIVYEFHKLVDENTYLAAIPFDFEDIYAAGDRVFHGIIRNAIRELCGKDIDKDEL